MENQILVFKVRTARQKSIDIAMTEAENLLEDLDAKLMMGGPLSGKKGTFCMEVPSFNLDDVTERLPHIGYTKSVDLVDFDVIIHKKNRKAKYNT